MKKIIKIIANLMLCASFCINNVSAVSVSAKSAVVIDADTNEVLYGKNQDEVLSMASTTKIMTAIIALEYADLDRDIEILKEYTLVEGSSMYLSEGEQIKMIDLIYGLMLMSGNDAAVAIAHETTGNYEEFILLMNEKAKELGLENTSFQNPNGLDDMGHNTTAYELAIISSYALKNEQFCQIVSSQYYKDDIRTMKNHNKMLWLSEDSIGVKTGYTSQSGRCLVSASAVNDKVLICVTLDAPSDWADHLELLETSFSKYNTYTLHKKDDEFEKINILGGHLEENLVLFNEDINLFLTQEQYEKLEIEIYAKKINYAPIKKDEIYGKIVYNIDNVEIYQSELIFANDINYEQQEELSIMEKFIDFIKNLFY